MSIESAVDIVLATYNGERYLNELIGSILAQSHRNIRLVISDDGSQDQTIPILRKWERADPRILIANTIAQGGPVANFAKGLEFTSARYLMFADQDDVWMPGKVAMMLAELQRLEEREPKKEGEPALSFSDAVVVDGDLQLISSSFYKLHELKPSNNFDPRYLLWQCTIYGCTVIFNRALYEICLPIPSDVPMHDQWLALHAALYGKLSFLNEQTINYRQHGHNVIGAKKTSTFYKAINIIAYLIRIHATAQKIWNQLLRVSSNGKAANGSQNIFYPEGFFDRIRFVRRNIIPFWQEKKIYTLALMLCLVFASGFRTNQIS